MNDSGRSGRQQWLIPIGLISLALVPAVAGASRLAQLGSGGPVTPANERFFASPVPVVVHVIGATTFLVLGAFQFSPGFRRRRPRWHRTAGRVVVPCGIAAALSGLWMSVLYPLPATDNAVLEGERLVVGSGMALSLLLALVAVRRRDIPRHRAWMMRGYAIGLGAGTQVFTVAPWILVFGRTEAPVRAVLMGAGWLINLAVAEYLIRSASTSPERPAAAHGRRAPAVSASQPGRALPLDTGR